MAYKGVYQKPSKGDQKARKSADHGAPGQAHAAGKAERDDHRADSSQTVRTNIFGQTKVTRGVKEGDLRDRWRG